MNISKADAIAQLAKWYDSGTEVRAFYKAITGSLVVIGKINELNPAAIKIIGNGCEVLLYFRDTSEYDYQDALQPVTEFNKDRINKYPTFINIKFSNSDRLEISESFPNVS
jgi:hypothetical protein